jgi:hypothetical protein
MLTIPIIPGPLESGASCFGGGGSGAGCKAFDGEWVGSAMKAQIPKVAACAWVGAVAAAALKECMLALAGTLAWVP